MYVIKITNVQIIDKQILSYSINDSERAFWEAVEISHRLYAIQVAEHTVISRDLALATEQSLFANKF